MIVDKGSDGVSMSFRSPQGTFAENWIWWFESCCKAGINTSAANAGLPGSTKPWRDHLWKTCPCLWSWLDSPQTLAVDGLVFGGKSVGWLGANTLLKLPPFFASL